MNHFLILGNHPDLSLAEIKAILGGDKPLVCGQMAVVDAPTWDGTKLQDTLAGTVKLGKIVKQLPIKELSAQAIAEALIDYPREGKILFGLSLYTNSSKLQRDFKNLPIQLKKAFKEQDRVVRWVTGDQGDISPAAIIKMNMTEEGYDLCLALTNEFAYIGLTTHVQNIDAWSLRDFGRPIRDTVNGMLPPKLARMMVNLGLENKASGTFLDPFCGGSTTLMEAILMHPTLSIIGSDVDAKQIQDSQTNLDWMVAQKLITTDQRKRIQLMVSPAQNLHHQLKPNSIDTIVTEGFLGTPLRGYEPQQQLEQQAKSIEGIWKNSFASFANIQKTGGKLVTICPEFQTNQGHARVQLAQLASEQGYRQIDTLVGWGKSGFELTYARPDQKVKRIICVFIKEK